MRPVAPRKYRIALFTVLVAALGCDRAPDPPPTDPAAAAALQVFGLSGGTDSAEETRRALFGEIPDGRDRAVLGDALSRLDSAIEPRVTAIEELEGLDRTIVDLVASLPGGGQASFSVQLEPAPDGDWRVLWFQGPGVEWPPSRRRRGEGLSVSSIPE